jgi:hypothetical protein
MGTLKGRQVNENEVAWLWDHYTYRFFAEGAIYCDVLELRDQIKCIDQWCPRWSEAARAAEQKADRALAFGFTQTARVLRTLSELRMKIVRARFAVRRPSSIHRCSRSKFHIRACRCRDTSECRQERRSRLVSC